MTEQTTVQTPHQAAARFTVMDLRAARKHYGRVIAANATESDVQEALLARALVSTRSGAGKAAYYAKLAELATEETLIEARAAFGASLDESDARRERAAAGFSDEDTDED